MEIVIEEIYNLIEAIMLAWFVTSYFKTNNKFQNKTAKLIVFTLIFIQINIVSILGLHWVFTSISDILLSMLLPFHLLCQCFHNLWWQ